MPPSAGFEVELQRMIASFWFLMPRERTNFNNKTLITSEKTNAETKNIANIILYLSIPANLLNIY